MSPDLIVLTLVAALTAFVAVLTVLQARFLARSLERIEGIAAATFLQTRNVDDALADLRQMLGAKPS
jgi:hypothetical protein